MGGVSNKRKDIFGKLDLIVLAGIVVGIICMGQPFSKFVFTLGFPIVFVSAMLHILFDHLS